MKKVRKLLAFVLALTMIMTVVPAAWMGVYADETAASNVIAEFDGTGLTVGSDNDAAFANYKAIRGKSFDARNVYSDPSSTFVNKMYAYIQEYIKTVGIPKKIIDVTKVAFDDLNEDLMALLTILKFHIFHIYIPFYPL